MSVKDIFEICLIFCLAVTEYSKADGDVHVHRRLFMAANSECPRGHYCPKGALAPLPCPAGTYNNLTRQISCRACPAGYYCPQGTTTYTKYLCPVRFYCPAGSAAPIQCSAGTLSVLKGQSACITCPPGRYCPDVTVMNDTQTCPPGMYCPAGSVAPILCPAGTYNDKIAQTTCAACPAGYYCPAGSTLPMPCPPGTFRDQTRGTSMSECIICPTGHYCTEAASVIMPCPSGSYNDQSGSANLADCITCPCGKYCDFVGLAAPTGDCTQGMIFCLYI